MIIDGRQVPAGREVAADICIVGAGAAGITIALELAESGVSVVILESGGPAPDSETQDLARGDVIGIPYHPLESARLRCLGGTTAHWGGWCRELDDGDFETRDWLPRSGWPFGKAELRPYYARARTICQMAPLSFEPSDAGQEGAEPIQLPGFESRVFQRTAPTRFGPVYGPTLRRAEQVTVYLHSTVIGTDASGESGRVRRLDVATAADNTFTVRARFVVFAAGGIDNARLLLAFGLGNRHGMVGRCFMEHVDVQCGTWLVIQRDLSLRYYTERTLVRGDVEGTVLGALGLQPDRVRRERVAGGYITELYATAPSGDDPMQSHLARVLGENAEVSTCRLGLAIEQAPNLDSRVTLMAEKDRFGVPRAQLDWRLSDIDHRTIARTASLFAEAVGAAGMGRVKLSDPSTFSPRGQWHHMGTTRMHDDPTQGVVDANCRVHGIENVFVAGSSVFPTSGYANPTLTLVALASRLAAHLRVVESQAP